MCFGCGRTNLFGLLLEVEGAGDGSVRGRCFIKQDHQGAHRGFAHDGIVATALTEAMAYALAADARAVELQVTFEGEAPVGAWLDVAARAEGEGRVVATASVEGTQIASAGGLFAP